MSGTEKFKVVESNKFIITTIIVVVLLGFIFLILPLYLQNRIHNLYRISRTLQEKIVFLKSDVLHLELKINELSSLEHLSSFADSTGLGLYDVPQKIMILEASHE